MELDREKHPIRDKKKLPLNEKQLEILTIIQEGLEPEETAKYLDIDISIVNDTVKLLSKNELLIHFPNVFMKTTPVPELDDDSVIQQMTVFGFPNRVVQSVRKRLAIRRGEDKVEVKAFSDGSLINELEKKTAQALYFLDDFSFAGATAKELAGVIDTMIEKTQLLKGKPTSITSIEDRRKINELLPVLLDEAKRRGVIIDGIATEVA